MCPRRKVVEWYNSLFNSKTVCWTPAKFCFTVHKHIYLYPPCLNYFIIFTVDVAFVVAVASIAALEVLCYGLFS